MRIVPADRARLDEVLAAYRWLFEPPGEQPPDWDPERAGRALAAATSSDRANVLVALDGDRIIGFCTAYLDLESVRFGRRCWVEDLAVDPERRSRGVGAALLDAARQWAWESGATHLELDTADAREDAQRFYDRQAPSWRSVSYAWKLGGSGR